MPGVGSTRKTSQPKRNGVKENERERERKGKVVTRRGRGTERGGWLARRAAFVYNTSRDGVKTCGLESYVDPSSACRRIELIPLISANDFAIVHPRVSVSIVKGPRRSKLVYIQMRLLYIAPISSLSLSLPPPLYNAIPN